MRSTLLRTLAAIYLRCATIQNPSLARYAHHALTSTSPPSSALPTRHLHLAHALRKRKDHQYGEMEHCTQRARKRRSCSHVILIRKKRRVCAKNPRTCRAYYENSFRGDNSKCCPCEQPERMDPYRRQ